MEQTQTPAANSNDAQKYLVLPVETDQALKKLIKISEQLCSLAEKETQALIKDEQITFAILQQEKELISRYYAQASAEFRSRLEEFRGADRATLDKLEALQKQLGEKTKSNNTIVERMYNRAKKKTHATLLSVQELAQTKLVHINANETQEGV